MKLDTLETRIRTVTEDYLDAEDREPVAPEGTPPRVPWDWEADYGF